MDNNNIGELLSGIKTALPTTKPNYIKLPVTAFSFREEDVKKFNSIYYYLKEFCKDFNTIQRTKSGGISLQYKRFPMWDIRTLKSCVEITVLSSKLGDFRLQLRTLNTGERGAMSGHTCFKKFKSMLLEDGITLEDWAIDNGREVKETIPKLPVDFCRPQHQGGVYENVHHIDINSSFFAGIADEFEEFRPTIERIYKKRKENPVYKDILTHTQGFMQSTICGCKYAHISKAGIVSNNRKIDSIVESLRKEGFIPLMTNTDGVWYRSPNGNLYHDENEGTELGQWKHDHTNCTFQAKSKGAYHFIEGGKCTTVLRGCTKLDRVKKREDWSWDDLFNACTGVYKVIFTRERGAEIQYEQ